jgi:hypothetical protein
MRTRFFRVLTMSAAALLIVAQASYAQSVPATSSSEQSGPVFSTEELDQILAPIALYPDELLAQVLMASTYPLEIVEAERWSIDPGNAKLAGDQLIAALAGQTWDPSVKSLVPFPQVLQMMSAQLSWTQRLGDAFLAQQPDVLDSVQRLRAQAQTAGKLATTEQQVVTTQAQTIIIQQANPQIIYVPTYNPAVVYGVWRYPAYPPYYYPPPPAYYPGSAFLSGMAFAAGVAIVGDLWGWGNCNWGRGHGHGNIHINVNHYNKININNINAGRATTLPANSNAWRHDPIHRKGVAYRDAGTRQQYLGQRGAPSAAARDFRGFTPGQGVGATTGQRPAGQGTVGQRPATTGMVGQRPAAPGAVGQRPAATGTAGQRPAAAGAVGQRPAATGAVGQRPVATGTDGQRPAGTGGAGQPFKGATQTRQPSAFGGMGTSGANVGAQSQRGAASRGAATKQFKGR